AREFVNASHASTDILPFSASMTNVYPPYSTRNAEGLTRPTPGTHTWFTLATYTQPLKKSTCCCGYNIVDPSTTRADFVTRGAPLATVATVGNSIGLSLHTSPPRRHAPKTVSTRYSGRSSHFSRARADRCMSA